MTINVNIEHVLCRSIHELDDPFTGKLYTKKFVEATDKRAIGPVVTISRCNCADELQRALDCLQK